MFGDRILKPRNNPPVHPVEYPQKHNTSQHPEDMF